MEKKLVNRGPPVIGYSKYEVTVQRCQLCSRVMLMLLRHTVGSVVSTGEMAHTKINIRDNVHFQESHRLHPASQNGEGDIPAETVYNLR